MDERPLRSGRDRRGGADRRVRRCAAHACPNPLLDLGLFRSPSFRWANRATLIFAIGFNAMFLGNVLFLTNVWGYSILRAGLAISLGPLTVAVLAPMFGKLAGRIGQRRLLIPGGLIWGVERAAADPACRRPSRSYVAHYLPSVLLSGLGVALCLPQLSSASVQSLPPDRFGSGSAVNQVVRNLGATLGVALVVAFTAQLTAGHGARRVPSRLVAARRQRHRGRGVRHPPAEEDRCSRRRRAGGARRSSRLRHPRRVLRTHCGKRDNGSISRACRTRRCGTGCCTGLSAVPYV